MVKIFGGMDVSGNPGEGNHRWIGIIMCREDHHNYLVKQLNIRHPNWRRKLTRNRKIIASKLNFDNNNALVLGCKIDQNKIIDEYLNKRKIHDKYSREELRGIFNDILYQQIKERLENFAMKCGCALSDVDFQIDSDCMDLAKNRLSYDSPSDTHVFADTIAWLANRNKNLPWMIRLDLVDHIRKEMGKRLK